MNRERGDREELSRQEAQRLAEALAMVKKINDPRLRADEDLEYFTIHFKNKVTHIPKRRITESPEINGYIESGLRQMLQNES